MEIFQSLIDRVSNGAMEPSAIPEPNYAAERIRNFLADREKKDQIKKVLLELVEQTKYLTRQDIGNWRRAWQRAISVEWPSRVDLHAIYRDIRIDGQWLAVTGQIKKEVLQKVVVIVKRDDPETEIPELSSQLEDAQWFIDYCDLVIDSILEGYRLAEFGEVIDVNGIKKFSEVEAVDPDHVIPEHNVFVRNISDSWKNGIDYTKPPYNQWVIGIGKKKDLGLLNAIAPHALAKKNMLAFWDKFGEIFGMPIRVGKTNTNNAADRRDMADMLEKMGAASWGLFNDGTEIEIIETTRGDAWQVYDKRIERANSEISKAIIHQTMTTDNGSSKSQSETHLTIQEKVIEYFARLVRIAINDKLIPFMIMHGFKGWENAKAKYDDTKEYSIEEVSRLLEVLLQHYDIDADHIKENYNIPVTEKKQPGKNENPGNFFD